MIKFFAMTFFEFFDSFRMKIYNETSWKTHMLNFVRNLRQNFIVRFLAYSFNFTNELCQINIINHQEIDIKAIYK